MKILITNQNTINVGDDAAAIALIQQIREIDSKAQINIVYNASKDYGCLPIGDERITHEKIFLKKTDIKYMIKYLLRKMVHIRVKNNKLGSVGAYIEVVQKSDIVIFSPQGANIGKYKRWASLFRVLVPILEKKQLYFQHNTIGKSGNILFDLVAKYVLKRSFVVVRESKSYEVLKRNNINSIHGVDTVFSLPNIKTRKNNNLVFIPTEVTKFFGDYKSFDFKGYLTEILIPQIVDKANKYSLNIVLLTHVTNYNGLYEKDLFDYIYDELKKLKFGNEIIITDHIKSYLDYEKYISSAKLVISMRYHGIIFAIKNGIPFIALSYENKMKDACSYSEMMEYYQDLSVKPDQIAKKIDHIVENYFLIEQRLRSKHNLLERLSRISVDQIFLDYIFKNIKVYDNEKNI